MPCPLMPMTAFASAIAFATGSEGSSESSSLKRATFCAIVRSAVGEPSGAAADLGAALDGAAAEAEAADGAAAAVPPPPTGDIAAPAGDEACRSVVCWLVA